MCTPLNEPNEMKKTKDGVAVLRPRIESISVQPGVAGTATMVVTDGRATLTFILGTDHRRWLAALLLDDSTRTLASETPALLVHPSAPEEATPATGAPF
ncbi:MULTISPECIES: hypothetical protein [Cupriavidus]